MHCLIAMNSTYDDDDQPEWMRVLEKVYNMITFFPNTKIVKAKKKNTQILCRTR